MALKNLFDRGLLYQGHKIVWWWAQGAPRFRAARSARATARWPTRAFMCDSRWSIRAGPLADADLLVWTTTPWTLPGNQFAAVKPDLEYAVVSFEGESRKLVMAAALVEHVAKKAGRRA